MTCVSIMDHSFNQDVFLSSEHFTRCPKMYSGC